LSEAAEPSSAASGTRMSLFAKGADLHRLGALFRAVPPVAASGKPDGARNWGYDGFVGRAKNTCEFVVGRLLEIRVVGFRSGADIRAQTAGIAQAVASLPKDTKYVIAGDWRGAQIMAPEMAEGAAEMRRDTDRQVERQPRLALPGTCRRVGRG
jgi:hypothetical protein